MKTVPPGSALLVIDVQRGYINDATRHLPERLNAFLDDHLGEFDRVVAARFENTESCSHRRLRGYDAMAGPPDTDLCPGIERPGVEVITKSTYSVFREPAADVLLAPGRIRTLYITGLNTGNCVVANAFDAFDRGLDPVVLADLCGSFHGRDAHERALELMRGVSGIRVE
jgi:nicotinamidase-related amidase